MLKALIVDDEELARRGSMFLRRAAGVHAGAKPAYGPMVLTESVAPRGSAFQARLLKESRQDAAPTEATEGA